MSALSRNVSDEDEICLEFGIGGVSESAAFKVNLQKSKSENQTKQARLLPSNLACDGQIALRMTSPEKLFLIPPQRIPQIWGNSICLRNGQLFLEFKTFDIFKPFLLVTRLAQLSEVKMGVLTSHLARLRKDPRLLHLPPFIALLCILGGIAWMLLLPLDEYSRKTYVSENALLPGQVHTYFTGSEQNIYRAYRREVADVLEPTPINDDDGIPTNTFMVATDEHKIGRLQEILRKAGLKTATQAYNYQSSGNTYSGENVYTIVHGPRADGTESIVIVAPIRNIEGGINTSGVALLLTLARYFSRWSLWSKDIILVITPDSIAGPQAFVDAYHSMHDSSKVEDLTLKSGHIQGAIVIDYPFEHRFGGLHVAYDGVNGQLPNLDLINTAVSVASGQMGIPSTIQHQHSFTPAENQHHYLVRLQTTIRGMASQAIGHSTGAHSVFMPYHIDALTLTAVGDGWQDEMAFGRTVESLTRSLNNLLEKMHQSFFFFILLQNTRFVSIGTYLPSAMAIGAAYTIVAIWRWISSGYEEIKDDTQGSTVDRVAINDSAAKETIHGQVTTSEGEKASELKETHFKRWRVIDRPLTIPVAILATLYLSSTMVIFSLVRVHINSLVRVYAIRSIVLMAVPMVLAMILQQYLVQSSTNSINSPSAAAKSSPKLKKDFTSASTLHSRTVQLLTLLSSMSLLILGLQLTVLATLNFSLSTYLGLLCFPMAFVNYATPKVAKGLKTINPTSGHLVMARNILSLVALVLLSPSLVPLLFSFIELKYVATFRAPVGILGRLREYLESESLAWNISGGWTTMIALWSIWAPAWIIGMTQILMSLMAPPRKDLVLISPKSGKAAPVRSSVSTVE